MMNLSDKFRLALFLIIFCVLCWFTYGRIRKLMKEETIVSNSYLSMEVHLPSITVCVKWLGEHVPNSTVIYPVKRLSLFNQQNWTFHDYQNNIKSTIPNDKWMPKAQYNEQVGDKGGKNYTNLLEEKMAYTWEDSYWVFRGTLLPCRTLNIPLKKLKSPSNVDVGMELAIYDVEELFIDIHERGQSKVNQRWGWESSFLVSSQRYWYRKTYEVSTIAKAIFIVLVYVLCKWAD